MERCAYRRNCAGSMLAAGPARNDGGQVGDAIGTEVAFQGAMVSIMILMPAIALSISACTRSTSALRNACSCWSSDESPSNPAIDLAVNRATEDSIRSASATSCGAGFGIFCSANLPVSASSSAERDFSNAASDDVGAFIRFSITGYGFVSSSPGQYFRLG